MWQNDTGIYLVHNEVCVAESTFLQVEDLQLQANGGPQQNGLHCLFASDENAVTSAQVNWLYPNGNLVDCSNGIGQFNDISCSNIANNNGAILYASRFVNDWPIENSGVYTCCLLGNCSDGSSNRITVQIFGQSSVLLIVVSIFLLQLTLLFEISIHLDVESITDLYVTLPEDVTAVPQKYTIHCLINIACECAAASYLFNYYMFMEGSLGEPAIDYCNEEPSLSCSEKVDNNNIPIVDNQLIVTWNATTVITQGDYHTPSTPANGDHNFWCAASYTGDQVKEQVFVSIRGIYMHSHA